MTKTLFILKFFFFNKFFFFWDWLVGGGVELQRPDRQTDRQRHRETEQRQRHRETEQRQRHREKHRVRKTESGKKWEGEMEIDARAVEAAVAEQQNAVVSDEVAKQRFKALTAEQMNSGTTQFRRIRIPAHRYTPLQKEWQNILAPLVEHMHLAVRFNPKSRSVEMKTGPETEPGALAKGADFVAAFAMGFEVQDAVALLRLDDLFVDSFEVCDVKRLSGDHLSRAIGRIAGQGGKTKNAIENATRTRIVVADQRIHILGGFQNIKVARDAICRLILGAPNSKVYNQMRGVASRMNERF